MTQYPANGALFGNERKTNDRQPDYTGTLDFDREVVMDLYNQLQSGTEQPKASLSGWRKTSKSGKPFLSLKASVMSERRPSGQRSYQAPPPRNNIDDEIPF
jgi:hypothetical protein